MRDIAIVGCGGFGREVLDVVEAINAADATWNMVGFFDDSPSDSDIALVRERGFDVIGGMDSLAQRPDLAFAIGIGTGHVRRLIDDRLAKAGLNAATLVHPHATIGGSCVLAPGSVLCSGARVTTNVTLGRHVHINLNSTVGHDCVLDDYVTVNPLVAVSGSVTVGAETLLGTHSSVLQGLSIGAGAVVGAGACVVRDVAPSTTVKGVPAR